MSIIRSISLTARGLRRLVISLEGRLFLGLLPANTVNLVSGGTSGLVIDKSNLTLIGSGPASVIKARDGSQLNQVITASSGNNNTYSNFKIDGNRSNGGTNPTFGCNLALGQGGASHVLISRLEITASANQGVLINDGNVDIEISSCYIHNNGGVTNTSGTGVGIFVYWANPVDTQADGIRIINNYISENHNTLTNAGPSSAIAIQGKNVLISGNYILNNYNDGGQVVISSVTGPAIISNNTIIRQGTGLAEHTSGIESDGQNVTMTGNIIMGHATGSGIALEGNPLAPSGIGAANTTICGNVIFGPGGSVDLLNAGGITRATIITGNRFAAVNAMFVDTATSGTTVSNNNFMDCPAPYITDNSVDGVFASGNFPVAANFAYRGSITSANAIVMKNGQVATVTGFVNIAFISLPAETAGANGAGCTVTLIPSIGSTWRLAAGGGIGAAFTPTPGVPVTLVSDGNLFWAS